MIKKIFYFLVIATVLFIVAGLFLPKQVHVERSVVIERSPATLFAVLNSYRSFAEWSPWSDRDPAATYQRTGPEAGPGARLSWSGDPRLVGTGWQEIVESRPHSLVRMQLEFEQQGTATSYFQLDPVAAGTRVTWGFDSDLVAGQGWMGGILARYFGLFFDAWIGTDYEQGLARLKTYAESLPAADFSTLDVERVDAEAVDILYVDTDAGFDAPDITANLASAYREITAYMAMRGIERSAQPMTITRVQADGAYEVVAAIPVRLPPAGVAPVDEAAAGEEPADPPPAEIESHDSAARQEGQTDEQLDSQAAAQAAWAGRVRLGHSPAGPAVRAVHRGPYERMGPTYEKLAAWMAAHGLEEGDVSWEQYISDPGETPEDERITHIYFRVSNDL